MIAGAVMAAMLFFIGGVALRLLIGPISLGPFAGAIEDSLNQTVRGLVVRFDQAVLEWSRDTGKINLIILGTKVFDTKGRIIAQAPKADLDFDIASLMAGDFALKRFALVGVQLTAVRNRDGSLKLGVGPTPGDADLLQIIRETLRDNANTGGSLETFAIRNSRLAFRDEQSGLFLISPAFGLTVQSQEEMLEAALDASIEVSGAASQVSARFTMRDNGTPEHGTFGFKRLKLSAFAANAPAFAALAPFALATDLDAQFVMDAAGRFATLKFTGAGTGTIEAIEPGAKPVRVEKISAAGTYDGASNRLEVSDITISGGEVSGRGSASATLTWDDAAIASADLVADFNDLAFAAPGLFAESVRFQRVTLRGVLDAAQKRLDLQRVLVNGGRFALDLSGAADFGGEGSPGLTAKGSIGALSVRELLHHWPIGVGEGARQWMSENVSEGNVGPFAINVNIPGGALDAPVLPESALSVTFPYSGVTATYVQGLTPITRAYGSGTLSGDTFSAIIAGGAVGPLAVRGTGILPDLHIAGSPGDFTAHVEGTVFDVLELLNQKPLGYPRRFGIDPATASGHASLDLVFKVPMLKNLNVEDIGISVTARMTEMSLAIDKLRKLERTNADFTIDGSALSASGSAILSGVPLNFTWRETFADTPITTRITAQGGVDEAGRTALGMGSFDWLIGPADMSVTLTGKRFAFDTAQLSADLAPTTIDFSTFNLQKKAGVPASVSAMIHFGERGAMSISDLSLVSQGINVRGAMGFDAEGAIVSASFPSVKTSTNDFQLSVESAGGMRTMRMTGASFDASRLFSGSPKKPVAEKTAAPPWPGKPLSLDVRVRRVALRDNLALRDFAAGISFGVNQRLNSFSLSAGGPGPSAKVTGHLGAVNGGRVITLESDDAGAFLQGLTGVGSIRDGEMHARAEFPVTPDPDVDYRGSLLVTNMVLVDQPFLARFFSAGSLDGPLRLLGNQGIVVEKLEAPFHARGNLITVGEGRASGPAIGVSFKGQIDRSHDTLDLSGTLVPVYGLNSMLGALPVLGDILVSKQGEGIFGLTYRVHGDIGEPQTSINPLSALTPGIFRRIFEYDPPKPAPQAQVQPVPPAPTIPPAQAVPPAPQTQGAPPTRQE